jgi:DNA-binding beta-propeller fold protein YncE
MRSSSFTRSTVGVFAAGALLAGCGSVQSPSLIPGGASANVGHADQHRSWMNPAARSKALLYVSDIGAGDVYAFAYPKGTLMGTLTGFDEPAGLCADKSGNVWIAEAKAAEILKYAHGGTKPIATIDETGQEPIGCAIDPTTGNLAVSNVATTTGGNGSVSVYLDASGTPTNYTDSVMPRMTFVGYDDGGNLFVDGANGSSTFEFAELASGGNALTNINLNQSFEAPGGVAWDGKYMAVGDLLAGVVYQFSITASGATEEGSTDLTGGYSVEDFSIPLDRHQKAGKQGDRIIGPSSPQQQIGFWKYPKGGEPTKTITQGVDEPFGSAISRGKT